MSELAEQIRALTTDEDGEWANGFSAALDRAAALADQHQATQLSNDERLEYQMALIWCSAAADFAPEGQAREGWLKLCKPLIDRQPIEGASRDDWSAWLDDLPLPDGFEEGIAALQRFIAGLPADQHQADADALAAAAYEAAAKAIAVRGTQEEADFGLTRATQNFYRARDIVRALTPADARAELDRIKAEARREGMRKAAGMLAPAGNAKGGLWAKRLENRRIAILAAAEKEAGNG